MVTSCFDLEAMAAGRAHKFFSSTSDLVLLNSEIQSADSVLDIQRRNVNLSQRNESTILVVEVLVVLENQIN